MDHLTIDEILEFVCADSLTPASIRLCAYVNGHIRKCDQCLQLVRAFQMLYDEFQSMQISGDFKRYALEALPRQLEAPQMYTQRNYEENR